MAVLVNQVTANTKDSSTVVRSGWAGVGGADTAGSVAGAAMASVDGSGAFSAAPARGSQPLSGTPTSKCNAAQPAHAPRQPHCVSIQADSGQPTVLANPAINVMPVMAPRAPWPYSRTSVANAASYRPDPMATPISTQAANRPTGPCASAMPTRLAANNRLVPTSTGRPPWRSMPRPAKGPSSADTMSATENAANTVGVVTPRSRAMGAASMAGR